MELLPKIGIYLAIFIGISFFVLFLVAVLPHIIQDSGRQWEEALDKTSLSNLKSEKELRMDFEADPIYQVFKEKYPESGDHFRYHGNGRASMEVMAMNFDNFNLLNLEMDIHKESKYIDYRITCTNEPDDIHVRVNGELSEEFIKNANCLGEDGLISSPSNLVDDYGNPVPIRIPEPKAPNQPNYKTCGEGYSYDDSNGVCLLDGHE